MSRPQPGVLADASRDAIYLCLNPLAGTAFFVPSLDWMAQQ